MILIVEDEPDVRELLELLLAQKGYRTAVAADGVAARELVARGGIRPDLILADYNLPNGINGLQVAAKLQEELHRKIPVVVLTGEISTAILREIDHHDCVQLNKPVKAKALAQAIQHLLQKSQSEVHPPAPDSVRAVHGPGLPVIFVVDDDNLIRDGFREVLEADGRIVEDYATGEAFLETYRPGREGCLLIDAYLPGMSGLEVLQRVRDAGHRLPTVMITGNSDVPMAVQAMKAGASDFIEKPVERGDLIASVERALERSRDANKLSVWQEDAANSPRDAHSATAPDHGTGPRRPPEQEYRRGSRHQPAYR